MSFRERLITGVGYTTLGQFITYGIRLGSSLILTRLLAPDLMGLMAIGATFSYAAILLSDVGLRSAIIQDPRADDADYRDSVWTIVVLRGVLIGAVMCLLAGMIWLLRQGGVIVPGSVYADPRLLVVMMLLGIAEIVRGTESINSLYRERKLDFHYIFVLQTSKQAVGTGVAVLWAWLDPGVVALCASAIFGNLYGSVLSHVWRNDRLARFVWRVDDFKYVLSQGKWFLVSSTLTFMINSIDRLYLASAFSATDLGIYSIATTLGFLALDLSTRIGSSVIFPVVSERLRDGSRNLAADYYKIRRPFEYFALSCGFFLLAFGSDIVRLLYDPRYHSAGPILRIFGLLTILIAYAPAIDSYLAMGKPKINSIVSFVRLVSLIVGLWSLVPSLGVMGGAAALVVSHLCGVLTTFVYNRRLGLFSWRQELRLFSWLGLGFAAVGGLEYLRSVA